MEDCGRDDELLSVGSLGLDFWSWACYAKWFRQRVSLQVHCISFTRLQTLHEQAWCSESVDTLMFFGKPKNHLQKRDFDARENF